MLIKIAFRQKKPSDILRTVANWCPKKMQSFLATACFAINLLTNTPLRLIALTRNGVEMNNGRNHKGETMKQLSEMTKEELTLEAHDLRSAQWNAARGMPPRQITPEYKQRWSDVQQEMNRRTETEKGIKTFRITARKHPNGTWEIDCPEWKYCRAVKNLTKELAMLTAEIESTLEENAK
jgi:hypothetical protein